MAVLVTGGTGFAASNVVRTLAERGERVVCFDVAPPSDLLLTFLGEGRSRVEFAEGDITAWADLSRLSGLGISHIVHAAAFTGIQADVEREEARRIVEINIMGTTNVLELARRLKVERFLHVSSNSVYGLGSQPPGTILHEATPAAPDTLYAVTKYSSELVARRYADAFELDVVVARFGTLFGPMERETPYRHNQSIIRRWTNAALLQQTIEVHDPNRIQSLSYIRDVADAACTLLLSRDLSYSLYNVETGSPAPLSSVVATLRDLVPDVRVEQRRGAPEPVEGSFMSPARLATDLGFRPAYDLDSAIRDYFQWRLAHDRPVSSSSPPPIA